jgi:hypothetical protein
MKAAFRLIMVGACSASFVAFAEGVKWEDQAERLQAINASFLDSVPFGDPIGPSSRTVGVRAVITFLPKVNPTVGAKTEDVPSAPAHLIPILEYSQNFISNESLRVSGGIHAGYLPAGGEKLLGLTASLSQYLFGGTAQLDLANIFGGFLYIPLGLQLSHAEVTGNITTKESNDEFVADTQLITTGIGYGDNGGRFWKNLLIISKSTTSKFDIEVDSTSLTVEDTLDDGSLPFAVQLGAGMQLTPAIRSGLAYLWVPERFSTGRILLNYGMSF